MSKLLKTFLPPLLVLVGVIFLWQFFITIFSIPPYNLPSPGMVANNMIENKNKLATAFLNTGISALTGFALSLALGYAIALFLAQSKWVERSFMPYAIFFQTVPIVAIAPLIIQWIGYGSKGVICVVCIISIFPIIANSHNGLVRLPKPYLRLFHLYQASHWQLFIHLRIPHSIPYFLAGAKISCGLSVIGAIVGEFFAGYSDSVSLGYLIQSSANLKTDQLFSCIIISTFLGFIMYSSTNLISLVILSKYQRNH